MKKIIPFIIISFLIVFSPTKNTFADGFGGTVKLGVDFEGDHEVSGYGLSGTEDVETGISLSAEFFAKIGTNLDIGGGITTQFPRSQKKYEGDFYFIPVYGAMRVRFETKYVAPKDMVCMRQIWKGVCIGDLAEGL